MNPNIYPDNHDTPPEGDEDMAARFRNQRRQRRELGQNSLQGTQPLEPRILLHAEPIKVNFQQDSTIDDGRYPELSGYVADAGASYGNRGNGFIYGWLNGQLTPDTQGATRNRNDNDSADERYDTLNHFIKGDNHSWQIALGNGFYDVHMVAGDPSFTDQINDLDLVSGDNIVSLDDPDGPDHWDVYDVSEFEVVDGLFRITPRDTGSNHKIAFLEITHRDDLEATPPAIVNGEASEVKAVTATLGATVTDDGNSAPNVTIFYGDNDGGTNANAWDNSVDLGVQEASATGAVGNLKTDTQYYFRSFAENSGGSAWAPSTATFRTEPITKATVVNLPASNVTATSATMNGTIEDSGNDAPYIIVYWGTADGGQNPTGWQNAFLLPKQEGDFSIDISDLQGGTNYYYRAVATNAAGTAWSAESRSFQTSEITAPVMGDLRAIDIEAFQALLTAEVLDAGNDLPAVTMYWGTSDAGTNGEAWQSSSDLGVGDGLLADTVTGLQSGTTYFYRAKGTNQIGDGWTDVGTFTTLSVSIPVVVHEPEGLVSATTAEIRGRVTDAGNDEPFIELFYGATDGGTDPAAWEQQVEVGFEQSAFAFTLEGLSAERDYFYRVRATNFAGTSWADASSTFRTEKAPALLITEFMASNSSSLSTRIRSTPGGSYGDQIYPDWIEIHNPGDVAVSLSGLYLTDDAEQLRKWAFPNGISVPAKGHLVVFASGEDLTDTRLDERGNLHANFRLSAGGEYLAVTSMDGVIHAYVPEYPAQLPDISYGIDAAGKPHFYADDTPGADNSNATLNLVADTKFSHDRGFYDEPFQLEIRSATVGATLVYTLDGSKPTKTNGQRVDAPNDSTPPLATLNIGTTSMVRVFAYKTGFESTDVDTQSYIFPEAVLQQATDPATGKQVTPAGFPTRWGNVTGDYQVDPDIVNHASAENRWTVEDIKAVPSLSVVMDVNDLFGSRQIYLSGSGSPRAASMELITDDGSEEFQIDGSVQIQGGSSTGRWKLYKLSIRGKFQAPFGPSKLNHALYEDSPVDSYDNVILDGVLNHSWLHSGQHNMPQYIQDQYVADLHNAMGGYSPYGRFMNIYLNGLYWGMYYVHDRPDHAWAAKMFGGNKEEFHAVKHNGSTVISNGNGKSARSAYSAMVAAANAVRSDSDSLEAWANLERHLDVDNFITYLLANWFTGNHDWPHKNWYATAREGGPWRFHSWDAEHVTDSNNDVGESPTDLHSKLIRNKEYQLRMADLIRQHFYNDGVLTSENTSELWAKRMTEVDQAIRGESARWGDNRSSRAHTRTEWMQYNGEGRGLLGRYFPGRSNTVLGQLKSARIYPSLDAPEFGQHGGDVPANYALNIRNPDNRGEIYFTRDGSDPRLPGGNISPAAQRFTANLAIGSTETIQARVLDGTSWSAMTAATFLVNAAKPGDLVVSELNYHPAPADAGFGELNVSAEAFEFVELLNASEHDIDLAGVRFVDRVIGGKHEGIRFDFAPQVLASGERIVVVRNRDAFQSRYGNGPRIADGVGENEDGNYRGQLDNAGEQLTLLSAAGDTLQMFRFNDGGPWPGRADGGGSSLEVIANGLDPSLSSSWRSSREFGGSPGADSQGTSEEVVINELLTHTDLPEVDRIEIFNPTGTNIDIGGWYISDSGQDYFRYRIPAGTTIAAGGYWGTDENQLGFGFKGEQSDDAWLIAADGSGRPTRFIDHVRFSATENGVSLGRWPNGSGELFPMNSQTFGNENSGPASPEVFISEFHYHPPADAGNGLTTGQREFVEVWNGTETPSVVSHWRLRGGVDFDFPINTILPAGGGAILVGFDPDVDSDTATAFRQHFNVAADFPLYGPFDGVLDNGGETLRIERPEDAADLGVGYILIDRVEFDDQSPWPTSADGLGMSLHRKPNKAYGDFASSWKAAQPSPGRWQAEVGAADLDQNGRLDDADIDILCSLIGDGDLRGDLNSDGTPNQEDYLFLIRDLMGTDLGDANLDGVFDSTDFIVIFQAGEYEDGVAGNSGWAEGDWNCDGEFNSTDLIVAFQVGHYEIGAVAQDANEIDQALKEW